MRVLNPIKLVAHQPPELYPSTTHHLAVNRDVLQLLLRQRFPESAPAERRVVARAAGDLADDGRFGETRGAALTPQTVVGELAEAPEDVAALEGDLVARWNWWVGALDLAHGGYDPFRIQAYASDDDQRV